MPVKTPSVYRPQAQTPSIAGLQKKAATRPAAPPVYRPDNALPVQAKMGPPAYRPQPGLGLSSALQPKAHAMQGRPPAALHTQAKVLQRMEGAKGFPGFYFGALSPQQQVGTYNTVWSQIPTPDADTSAVAHSSVVYSKFSKQQFGWAEIDLGENEDTHAEDKLRVYVHQYLALNGVPQDGIVTLDEFYVSASPCSSTFGTSAKSTGCAENLVAWATQGMQVMPDSGCPINVKVKIKKLVVDHLYKGNTYEGAQGSYAAMKEMKKTGAIGGWHIKNMPRLKDFQGAQLG